ncbi:MAG TPA: TRAP transporter large permease subunit [Candidatus Krumholzibacteria bacterium]|nr:TRAP transporter large permease subunit [Candidatus Krumholzibacteria bacterium]
MLALLGIVLGLLALSGMPLFAVFGVLAMALFFSAGIDISSVAVSMYSVAGSPLLVAIPLFTLAGYLFAHSKAPDRLVALSRALFPGGLAVVALVACAVFTAFTGASGVTIVAMGGLLLPALLTEGYSRKFSLGLVTASGSLGLLFPPSLPLIIYGYVAEVQIDKLFLAGILPGILLVVMLASFGFYRGRKDGIQSPPFSWAAVRTAVRNAAWEIPLPIIILGGIYGGIITVMEAAAITALYALVVEVFIYRDISVRKLPEIFAESVALVGGILVIIMCSFGFVNYVIDAEVPMRILAWMQHYISSKYTFLLILNLFLLVVGCLMDIFSALIVVVPLIAPVAVGFGVDPVHLGIVFLTNLEIGYLTPPVGLNLFISSFRFKEPVVKLYSASVPFLLLMLVALVIITYAPALSLSLVHLFSH